MAEDKNRDRQLVAVIAKSTTDTEKDALAAWATQLLLVRASTTFSTTQKARQAIRLTTKAAIIWPASKILSRELKRLGWDDRSWAARQGLPARPSGLRSSEGKEPASPR